jgi:hypothetical protein
LLHGHASSVQHPDDAQQALPAPGALPSEAWVTIARLQLPAFSARLAALAQAADAMPARSTATDPAQAAKTASATADLVG